LSYIGKQPKLNRTKYTPLSADPSNPAQGDVFYSDGTARPEGLWTYNGSAWEQVTSNPGGLDVFHLQDFETLGTSDFTSGQNATYKTAGSFGGTLADETSAPIANDRSPKYTAGASSTNDWFDVESITLDNKQKGEFIGISLYADTSSFSVDAEFVVWDNTNSQKLTTSLDVIEASTDKTRYSFEVFVPSNTVSISYGFHMVNAPVNTESFIFDDIEFNSDPFKFKNLLKISRLKAEGNAGETLTANVTDMPFIATSDPESTWSGTSYTMPFNGTAIITGSAYYTTTSQMVVLYKNGTIVDTIATVGNGNEQSFGITDEFVKGDVLSFRVESGRTLSNNPNRHHLEITALGDVEHVITPAKSTLTEWVAYTPTTSGFGAIGSDNVRWRQVGDSVEIMGYFTNGTVAPSEAQIGLPNSYTVKSDVSSSTPVGQLSRSGTTTATLRLAAVGGNTYLNVVDNSAGGGGLAVQNGNVTGSSERIAFHALVPVAELSLDATFLAAVPVQRVAYVKDVKSAGADSGTFTSGSWQTRDLTTIEGDSEIVSLSTNQFTLSPGKYVIEAQAQAYRVDGHKIRLRNITGGSTQIVGLTGYAGAADTSNNPVSLTGNVTITVSTAFELQHRCDTTQATQGFGEKPGFSDESEVYAQVKITKLK